MIDYSEDFKNKIVVITGAGVLELERKQRKE